jgi:hypothetical protein
VTGRPMMPAVALAPLLLLAVSAGAQPAAPASAPVDTALVHLSWPGGGPAPYRVTVLGDDVRLGDPVTVVLDFAADAKPWPADSLVVDQPWLEPVTGVQLASAGAPAAGPGPRLVAPFRAYRLGPWRAAWRDGPASAVAVVSGRLQGANERQPVRDPRALSGLPRWLPAIAAVLLLALLGWLLARRLRRRARSVAIDRPLPPPAWLQAALDLYRLEERTGHGRAYLDGLAAVARRYLEGRFHLPAVEMTADEVRQAAERAGWPAGRLRPFADLVAACDAARYAPADVGAARCREGVRTLLDLVEVERVTPRWTPVPAEHLAAADAAWRDLRRRYPSAREGRAS